MRGPLPCLVMSNARLTYYLERERLGLRLLGGALALLVVVLILGVLDERVGIPSSLATGLGCVAGIGAYILWVLGTFRVSAGTAPTFANLVTFLVLAGALLFTPRYLLLDLTGVERRCTVAAVETGSVTKTRTGTTGPASHLTLDCPGGRYEIRGARSLPPEEGSTVPVTFDRSGIVRPELTEELPAATWWMWPITLVPLALVGWFIATMPRERRTTLSRLTAFEEGQSTGW
jgi:hypothetical protein